jgi:hypothetical protein
MGFIAGMFLNFLDEDQSFWMLVQSIRRFRMLGFLTTQIEELNKAYYKHLVLVKKFLPEIYKHFVIYNYATPFIFVTLNYHNGFLKISFLD